MAEYLDFFNIYIIGLIASYGMWDPGLPCGF